MRKQSAILVCLLAALPGLICAQGDVDPSTGYPYSWEELRAMDEFDYESRWDDLNPATPCVMCFVMEKTSTPCSGWSTTFWG